MARPSRTMPDTLDVRNVPPDYSRRSATNTVLGAVLLAVVGYATVILIGPLTRLLKAAGGAADVASTVTNTVTAVADTVLGMGARWWDAISQSGAKFIPDKRFTVAYVSKSMGKMSYLDVVYVLTTWSYVMVSTQGGAVGWYSSPLTVQKWFLQVEPDPNVRAAAIDVLRHAIMFAYNWHDPGQGVNKAGPLTGSSMRSAGGPWDLHDHGVPMFKLYRGMATMADLSPGKQAETHDTAGYVCQYFWTAMFGSSQPIAF